MVRPIFVINLSSEYAIIEKKVLNGKGRLGKALDRKV